MKKIVAYLLFILGLIMIYLSWQIKGLPPGITGLGFILIGYIFLIEK